MIITIVKTSIKEGLHQALRECVEDGCFDVQFIHNEDVRFTRV